MDCARLCSIGLPKVLGLLAVELKINRDAIFQPVNEKVVPASKKMKRPLLWILL